MHWIPPYYKFIFISNGSAIHKSYSFKFWCLPIQYALLTKSAIFNRISTNRLAFMRVYVSVCLLIHNFRSVQFQMDSFNHKLNFINKWNKRKLGLRTWKAEYQSSLVVTIIVVLKYLLSWNSEKARLIYLTIPCWNTEFSCIKNVN